MKATIVTKNVPNEFKQIDNFPIPSTTLRLATARKPPPSKTIPFAELTEKMSILAEPKYKYDDVANTSHWLIRKSTLKYKATKKIKSLAKPKMVVPKYSEAIKYSKGSVASVNPKALTYQPTSRIQELAKPKYKKVYKNEVFIE